MTEQSWLIVQDPCPGVRAIRLNRPDRLNALSNELLEDLRGAITAADADERVRAIVLTALAAASAPVST